MAKKKRRRRLSRKERRALIEKFAESVAAEIERMEKEKYSYPKEQE